MGKIKCPVCGNLFDEGRQGDHEKRICIKSCTEFVLRNMKYQIGHIMLSLVTGECFEIMDARVYWQGEAGREFRVIEYGLRLITSEVARKKLTQKVSDPRSHILRALNKHNEKNSKLVWHTYSALDIYKSMRRVTHPSDLVIEA